MTPRYLYVSPSARWSLASRRLDRERRRHSAAARSITSPRASQSVAELIEREQPMRHVAGCAAVHERFVVRGMRLVEAVELCVDEPHVVQQRADILRGARRAR